MSRFRAACLLSLAAVLTGACVVTHKRAAEGWITEDAKSGGITVALHDDGDMRSTILTDPESADRIVQWLRSCPSSLDLRSQPVNQVAAQIMDSAFPTLKITAPRVRVSIQLMVTLETRQTPDADWSHVSWQARKEDTAFRNWAVSKIAESMQETNSK